MILFYAQSGNNEIVVTSPKLTFPGTAADPIMYGVQPVRYTTLDGKNHEFKNTDIEKFVYLPKNNGHNVFRIRFSKTFEGRDGCTVTLRAGFSSNRFQTFTLPFTASTTLETTASTEPLTISVSAKGSRLPATSYKAYVNSSLVGSPISTTSSGASIDTNDYREAASGVLEIVGATIDQGTAPIDVRELNRLMGAERTKFLSSSVFYDPAQEVSKYASYFYIYAEECDKEASDTIVEDCWDTNADNTGSGTIRLNNNSCTYARRAPNNVTIEHVPGGKVANATVKYIEENLPQDTDPITEVTAFDVHTVGTIVAGSLVTSDPTTESINIDGDNTTVVFEWTSIDTDSEFVTPMYDLQDKSGVTMSSNVGSSDDNRIYYFALFRTASAGCIDSTAINYDSSATRDDGSCVFCNDIIGQVTGAFTFKPSATTSATAEDNDDDTNFALNTTIKNPGSSLVTYLGTQAATVWTANIYKAEDVSLNDYGEQATVGTPVINNTSLGGNKGSATLPQFQKVPTASSGLNSGRRFVVELILTLGGCVHYFYQPFGIAFDGCTDPAATNYSPNRLNTGRGNCDYDAANRSTCDGLIQYEESGLWPQGSTGAFIVQLDILGTFDENGDEIPGSGEYTYAAYTYLQSTGEEVDLDEDSVGTGTINFLVEEGETLYVAITDTATGCFVSYTFINPNTGVVLGCTDPTAENYDPDATENDGSCLYCTDIILTAAGTNPTGKCSASNNDGAIQFTVSGVTGTAYTIYYNGPEPGSGYTTLDAGISNTGAVLGPGVYDAFVIATLSPDYSCTIPLSDGPVNLSVSTSGCGCTNPEADNYDPTATIDDGSCSIPGCTNRLAVNYNPGATYDDGTCVYSADAEAPLCIPNALDNNQQYEDFLNGLKNCIVNEGSTLLLKTRGGIKCDTIEQVKLSLISYLLNRIGLECMYNCNYTFDHGDVAVDCEARWKAGGPSGGEQKWSDRVPLVQGDIFSYESPRGYTQYWEVATGSYTTGITPPSPVDKVALCTDVTLPSGSETYLNTFINFARKFCTVCIVEPMAQSTKMQAIATTLTDIQLENGDNIEL